MKAQRVVLAGLPSVLPLESPSSWLTRAALAQGVTMREFLPAIGLSMRSDPDQQLMRGETLGTLKPESGSFAAALRIFGSLRRIDPNGGRFLLWTKGGLPRYRYCPSCLRQQRTPYFELHCRFSVWRYCPVHCCLLEDACPHCSMPVVLPASLLNGGPGRDGVPYVSHCVSCGKSLTGVQPVGMADLPEALRTELSQCQLINGRATLAALYHSCARSSDGKRWPLSSLRKLERMQLVPTRCERLTACNARKLLDEADKGG